MDIQIKMIAEWAEGLLYQGNRDIRINRISTDSRDIQKGDLFVCLSGPNFDGHDFIEEVFNKGGAGIVYSKEIDRNLYKRYLDKAFIRVKDTTIALGLIAKKYRLTRDVVIVAVTGSVGKTTTKELITAVLKERYSVLKNEKNYNNEIGVPKTIFALTDAYDAAVIEMGMRGIGQIAYLSDIVKPCIGVVTNVGETHLALLGSKENIAKAKKELVDAITPEGFVVLNNDDPLVREMGRHFRGKTLYYGLSAAADVWADEINNLGEKGVGFSLHYKGQICKVVLPLIGIHNISNALAAAGVGLSLGFTLEEIKRGLEKTSSIGMRGEIIKLPQGITLINDTYNASPVSVRAALDVLSTIGGKRTIFVMGDMLELGEKEKDYHRQIGCYAGKKEVDVLLTIGELAFFAGEAAKKNGVRQVHQCKEHLQAVSFLKGFLQEGDTVLFKGSRGMKLEQVIDAIQH